MICRSIKAQDRKNKILLVNAVKEVHKERSQSFLKPEHNPHPESVPRFPRRARIYGCCNQNALNKGGRLSIPLYIKGTPISEDESERLSLGEAWNEFENDGEQFWRQMTNSLRCSTRSRLKDSND